MSYEVVPSLIFGLVGKMEGDGGASALGLGRKA